MKRKWTYGLTAGIALALLVFIGSFLRVRSDWKAVLRGGTSQEIKEIALANKIFLKDQKSISYLFSSPNLNQIKFGMRVEARIKFQNGASCETSFMLSEDGEVVYFTDPENIWDDLVFHGFNLGTNLPLPLKEFLHELQQLDRQKEKAQKRF